MVVIVFGFFVGWARADVDCGNDLGCIETQLADLTKSLQTNKEAASIIGAKLKSIQSQINIASAKLKLTEANIKDRSEKVSTQYLILSAKIREMYMRLRSQPLWITLFSTMNMGEIRRELAYRQDSNEADKQMIVSLVQEIGKLETDKKALEIQKIQLAKLQADLDKQNAVFQKEIKTLSTKIAQLSAKQQQLIAEKLGSLNLPTSLGGGTLSCTDDRKLDPGFSNAFAFYTYGIPHRVGMDQYGAYGRAKAGQSAEDILRAYYANFDFVSGKEGETVKVNGKNEFGQTFNNESMNIEDYLKHLHEMPSGWDSKALQAQAIAARSYALSEQHAKGFLYPSQADQVIKKEINAQSWIDAVEATKGKIMAQGGQPIKAWYASTAGGYTFNSGDIWSRNTSYTKRLRDTTGDVGSFGDLQNNAYDRESPCFYSAQGWRVQYNKSAWLKSEEVADIVNVLLLAQKDSSVQNHLCYKEDPAHGCTDTWDIGRVQQELRSRGTTPYTNISNVSVSADFGVGKTTSINISGDAGNQTFSANDFIDYFNLRAPANIQIVGPLFNVERK